MAPKLQPYWAFVKDMRKKAIANGTATSDEELSSRWTSMSPEEKQPYAEIARSANANRTRVPSSTDPSSPATAAASASSPESKSTVTVGPTEMLAMVQEYLTSSLETAKTKEVLMVSTCLLMEYGPINPCVPVEIAFVAYSLEEGITSLYHKFTDPGPIPAGCMYESKLHSQRTHKIPVVGFSPAIGREDRVEEFRTMLNSILNHMKKSHRTATRVLLFTRADMMDQVRDSLLHYAREAQHQDFERMLTTQKIVIADTAFLIGSLFAIAGEPKPLMECRRIANSIMFDYKDRCPFHHEIDNNHCALSLCCRWCYLISDHLLAVSSLAKDIVPVPGSHLPLADTGNIHFGDGSDVPFWSTSQEQEAMGSDDRSISQAGGGGQAVPNIKGTSDSNNTARSRAQRHRSIPTGFSLVRGRGRGYPAAK